MGLQSYKSSDNLIELPENLFSSVEIQEKEKPIIDFDKLVSVSGTRVSHTQLLLERAYERKGMKFKREVAAERHSIDSVVFPDIAVFVDGPKGHYPEKDLQETEDVTKMGYFVLRFYHNQIMAGTDNSDSIADLIKNVQKERLEKYGLKQ